jgi:hypothetical protein
VVFFGPTGCGKSAIIESLVLDYGRVAIDLERFKLLRSHPDWAFSSMRELGVEALAAEDLSLQDVRVIEPDAYCVLILPERPVYEERRRRRDLQHPWKFSEEDSYDDFAANVSLFDAVIAGLEHIQIVE